MQDHAFFIALAYGVSAAALGIELVCVYVRSRRLRGEAELAAEPVKERP